MTEKTEWEVVDGPPAGGVPPPTNIWQVLQTALGPWWRWKIAGAAVAIGVALVLLATVVGITLLVTLAGATLALIVAKVRRWLHRDGAGPLTKAD